MKKCYTKKFSFWNGPLNAKRRIHIINVNIHFKDYKEISFEKIHLQIKFVLRGTKFIIFLNIRNM